MNLPLHIFMYIAFVHYQQKICEVNKNFNKYSRALENN